MQRWPARAAGWPGRGTHRATPAFPGAATESARGSAALLGSGIATEPHEGLGLHRHRAGGRAQQRPSAEGLGSGTVQGRNW